MPKIFPKPHSTAVYCVQCGGFRPKEDPHLFCKNCRKCAPHCEICASISPTLQAKLDANAAKAAKRSGQRRRQKGDHSMSSSNSSPAASVSSLSRVNRPPVPLSPTTISLPKQICSERQPRNDARRPHDDARRPHDDARRTSERVSFLLNWIPK
jgi:hypothetical protein